MADLQLQAGTARKLITPPLGIYLVGYGKRIRGNNGVHDELTATALVLQSPKTSLAWVSLDLLCLNEYIVDRIRAEIGNDIFLLISCSHTHSGPIAYADEGSARMNQAYMHFLIGQVVDAIQEALASLRPVRLTLSSGTVDIAVNRRERQPDGSIKTGINPEGVVDRSLNVISVITEQNERLATLVNTAAHGTVQGPKNRMVTADWMGAMRRSLEEELGGVVLFLQGATANLNPRHAWEGGKESWKLVEEQGEAVARQVKTALEDQVTLTGCPLQVTSEECFLPLESAVTSEVAPDIYRGKILSLAGLPTWLSFLVDPILNRLFPWQPRIIAHEGWWSIPMRINTVRIGELAVVCFAAESFTETGLAIKEKSPFRFTLFSSLTNGCIGYLPTEEAHNAGGYEVDLAPYYYRYPGRFQARSEKMAVKTGLSQLSDLCAKE